MNEDYIHKLYRSTVGDIMQYSLENLINTNSTKILQTHPSGTSDD